jgi:hypothetical protein
VVRGGGQARGRRRECVARSGAHNGWHSASSSACSRPVPQPQLKPPQYECLCDQTISPKHDAVELHALHVLVPTP